MIKQLKTEIKMILYIKLILVLSIIILLSSIMIPVIIKTVPAGTDNQKINGHYAIGVEDSDIKYYVMYNNETIASNNPFYSEIEDFDQRLRSAINFSQYKYSKTKEILLEMYGSEIDYLIYAGKYITSMQDYRIQEVLDGLSKVSEKLIYQKSMENIESLKEAMLCRTGSVTDSFDASYINISSERRQYEINSINKYLNDLNDVIENNNFTKFVKIRILQENEYIESDEGLIAILEKSIIDDPSLEISNAISIQNLQKEISYINDYTIPILEYRLANNIIPGEDVWQNKAMNDLESSQNDIINTIIISEKDFYKEKILVSQYNTYSNYATSLQNQIFECEETILIAKRSLDTGRPDMIYTPNGARTSSIQFLSYSIIFGLLAVVLAAMQVSGEFESGTIKLLLIRPRNRLKVLMLKYSAGISFLLMVYLVGCIINLITNGVISGFAEYSYPNYTVSGDINYLVFYLPKMLICFVPVLFIYSLALLLSITIRRTVAVIILPSFVYLVSLLINSSASIDGWVAYTPLPYLNLSAFFIKDSAVNAMIKNGVLLNLNYGIAILLALAIISTLLTALIFKKQDIAG